MQLTNHERITAEQLRRVAQNTNLGTFGLVADERASDTNRDLIRTIGAAAFVIAKASSRVVTTDDLPIVPPERLPVHPILERGILLPDLSCAFLLDTTDPDAVKTREG